MRGGVPLRGNAVIAIESAQRELLQIDKQLTLRAKMNVRDLDFYYGNSLALKAVTLPLYAHSVTNLIDDLLTPPTRSGSGATGPRSVSGPLRPRCRVPLRRPLRPPSRSSGTAALRSRQLP